MPGWSEKFLDSLKNDLLTFLSQKQFMHTVSLQKQFTHFFVAKMINAPFFGILRDLFKIRANSSFPSIVREIFIDTMKNELLITYLLRLQRLE